MIKLGILGVGKMGGAILSGITKAGLYEKHEILLCDSYAPSIENLKAQGYNATTNAEELFDNCQILLLSIKPQSFEEALVKAKDRDFEGRCVLSIAAGLSTSYIQTFFKNALIVRAMPNTPAQINMGVTTLCSKDTNNDYFAKCKQIFEAIGKCYQTTEDKMDYTLPLNGSMPAYLYAFAQEFIKCAEQEGIDKQTAKELTAHSIIASAQMILNATEDIETLIQNVCSKGGTTIAGLNKMYEAGFEKSIKDCYDACAQRSKELNK